ncbi:rhodanese-like domain-containing protein [Halogeometricum borinquense]|uniref:Rhodanese-related sulfurtransferase n=2 Tax=Halogeometricum borinquense TaxID=60847 RepID=E4NTA8_HALBP|nr:rhodanese-like domain-containing protein [Halogeometricum borinquense]ADQ68205.1 Rhodanese-related sulfurtransferase [Halogeometricum borinquense DSM 11551]ELY24751.1 rhodanese-related sulfurtransferase [Halogeometricum borinquense DSM 11551]QIB76368.1 rhodanese-like domain-containing protein [Halogeometricum borinquense]QIQ77793.1 rhodanese-like domain-containing protein [Halogeometricum borinquense]RYJ15287.1 rhodanese-like domain-containing protein [Halogeometricum borinquense]
MVTETDPETLVAKLEDDDSETTVVDIRDPSSYAAGHIEGAVNLPASRLSLSTVDTDWGDDVVVACYVGQSSRRVASLLDSHLDADVSSLRGGFDAWDGPTDSGYDV